MLLCEMHTYRQKFKLVEGPRVWPFYQQMLIKMRNRLDANVQISLCPYAEQQPLMVMASLGRLASRSTPIYCHIHRLTDSTLMVKTGSTCFIIME